MGPFKNPSLLVLLLIACGLISPPFVSGWGLSGHRITALIADHYFSEETKHWLDSELSNVKLWECSDDYKFSPITYPDQYDKTSAGLWSYDVHFVESRNGSPFLNASDCFVPCPDNLQQKGYCNTTQHLEHCCVVAGIEKMQDEVWLSVVDGKTNTSADAGNTNNTLLKTIMLSHWIGDIHQPLHVDIEDDDQGGNAYNVTWFGNATCQGYYDYIMPCELHLVWDTMIIKKRMLDFGPEPPNNYHGACHDSREGKYAEELVKSLGHFVDEGGNWFVGSVREVDEEGRITSSSSSSSASSLPSFRADASGWATDSISLSSLAYLVKENGDVGEEYYEHALPVVEKQVFLAGYRMAAALNFIFTSNSTLEAPSCQDCHWHAPLCSPVDPTANLR